MPSLRELTDAISSPAGDAEYRYECDVCDAEFTAAEPTVQSVSCPTCGAHSVRERVGTRGRSR